MLMFGASRLASPLTADGEGADRGGRQVDDLLAVLAQDRVVGDVRLGRGRVEHHGDIAIMGQAGEAGDALVGHRHAETGRTGEAVRVRVDADHRAHLEMLRHPHDLDHEVGSDVPEPMIAAFNFPAVMDFSPKSGRADRDRHGAEAGDAGFETVAGATGTIGPRPRSTHVSGPERIPSAAQVRASRPPH